MEIIANCDFKHGKNAYVKGQLYKDVDPKEGYYFMGLGWARDPEDEPTAPAGQDATLNIQNGVIGVSDNA